MHSESSRHLGRFGMDDELQHAFEQLQLENAVPGRVVVEHRSAYGVMTEGGEVAAQLTGRLRRSIEDQTALKPCVGDWVAVEVLPGEERAVILQVVPRRSWFARKEAGAKTAEQVIAANVDEVFIVSALDVDLNERRLERYLTLAWESGATPSLVLNKADLCLDVDSEVARVEGIALGIPIHVVSAAMGDGIEALRACLRGGRTVAFLGSSGVGKSSLVNALAGETLQDVAEIREDGKGKHTTRRRELVALPSGGVLMDTPGMRELQLWDAPRGVERAFDDVSAVAAGCRFRDCSHENEPGCAVRAAVRSGALGGARLESYRKLQRELARLEQKQSSAERSKVRRESKRRTQEERVTRRAIYEAMTEDA